jgi:ribosome biogenesis GTPase / thiamine phosphate phosphatase
LTLADLGWSDFFAAAFAPWGQQGFVPARVVAQKGLYQVSTGGAEHFADLACRLRHELKGPGVGKSTLISLLLGREVQRTREVLEDGDRGRHTTSHREIFTSPQGGLLIDTPGLREIQLWEGDQGIESTFAEVEALVEACRFADCRHQGEPGCAVEAAAASGELPAARLESYRKLQRELRQIHLRQDELARLQEKKKNKAAHRAQREHYRLKPR